MEFLKKLFGRGKNDTTFLAVTCISCSENFVVGNDSIIFTHETPNFSKGGREGVTSGSTGFLFDETAPDTISKGLFGINEDMKRLWSLTLDLVIDDLKRGAVRIWYCGKCGVNQEYNNWTVLEGDGRF